MQVGFTSAEAVPSVTWFSGYATLTFTDKALTELFAAYDIIQFEREYPTADSLGGGDILLKRVYKVRLQYDSLLPQLYEELRGGYDALEDMFIVYDPELLYDPSDYWKCSSFPDPCPEKMLDLINAKGAWEVTRGLPCIKIGISDIYFVNHTDLDAKVDNLSSLSSSVILPATSSWGAGPHGTEVAALAGAITNNGQGIASLGHDVKLAYYKMGMDQVLKAARAGCKVINCSWYNSFTYSAFDQLIVDTVHRLGTTLIVAAGNGYPSSSAFLYPASYAHVISVSAVGSQNAVGDYVHFRNWVDCHRWSFDSVNYPSEYNQTYQHNDSVDICAPGYWLLTLAYNNSYTSNMGTSLAAPQVAAAAALLLSLNPNFTPDQVEYYLKAGADNIYGVWDNNIWAGKLGAGRLNAGASLQLAKSSACADAPTDIIWYGYYNGYCPPGGAGCFPVTSPVIIANNDYWQYNAVKFRVAAPPTGQNVYWEFVSANNVVTKRTGTEVDFDLTGDDAGLLSLCDSFEVYVRYGTDSCCMSEFKKETAAAVLGCEGPKPGQRGYNLLAAQLADVQLANKMQVMVYPSPASNRINVKLAGNQAKKLSESFEIVSLDGRVLKRGVLTAEVTTLNIENLPTGIYLLRVRNSNTKFVKQ